MRRPQAFSFDARLKRFQEVARQATVRDSMDFVRVDQLFHERSYPIDDLLLLE
jgi:hypothetical protein